MYDTSNEKLKMKVENTSQQLRMLFVENPRTQTIFYELLKELKNENATKHI